METSSPLISVIIPIYNAAPYLDQALNSVRNQTYKKTELICLNDGSSDGSLDIIQMHASQDDRIIVIDKKNEGYGATCNRGLHEANGRWITIFEPDDWIEPTMFADMLSFADSFVGPVDIIKTPFWRIWMPDTSQQRKVNCSYRNRIKPPHQPFTIDEAAHLLTHHPSIWSALYRKDFLDSFGIRFQEYPGAGWADNPFLIETLCQAEHIIYLDQPYYCYREETPEKAAAFAHKQTLLPLERWNEMMDILERLKVEDESVLRAHNSRGFTYLSGIIEEVDLSHETVQEAAIHMFKRMKTTLVLTDPEISPGSKRMFAKLLGLPEPSINSFSYQCGLVRQGLYSLKNTGLSFTLFQLKSFLSKRGRREGS